MGVTSRVETVRLSNVQCASQSMDEKKRDKEDMNAQFWNHIIKSIFCMLYLNAQKYFLLVLHNF